MVKKQPSQILWKYIVVTMINIIKALSRYLWYTNKRKIKLDICKKMVITFFIITCNIILQRFELMNILEISLVNIFLLIPIIVLNTFYFSSWYEKVVFCGFYNFMISTPISKKKIILGLISVDLFLDITNYLYCIFIIAAISIQNIKTEFFPQLIMLSIFFINYLICKSLFIPFIIRFKNLKLSVLYYSLVVAMTLFIIKNII